MEAKFMNYAGNDEDIDRFFSMAASDSLQNNVIKIMHLAAAYHYDSTNPAAIIKLKRYFIDRLTISSNEYKNIVVAYKDKDPKRAADVANLTASLLEFSMRDFYNGMRRNIYASVMNTIREEDSAITVLTDTLSALREQYGINDIISPARYNIMLSNVQSNGKKGIAKGIELIQNIESVKDELVSDRAKHITLANQYATGLETNEMPLIHVIQTAVPPLKYWWRYLVITCCISGALGLLFGVVYVLLSGYYQQRITRRL
jgi:hypothetical protein